MQSRALANLRSALSAKAEIVVLIVLLSFLLFFFASKPRVLRCSGNARLKEAFYKRVPNTALGFQ